MRPAVARERKGCQQLLLGGRAQRGQGSPGAFPLLPWASRCRCPWAGRGALHPVTGQPHPQPLAPGLFARSSGQRAAVAKRCPPPNTICTLRAAVHSPVSAPSPSWRSAAHPASPLLQTVSDGALQALTTPLPRPQEAQTVPTGAWGASL